MPTIEKTLIPGFEPQGRCLARLSSRSGLLSDFRMLLENGGADAPQEIRHLIEKENVLARPTSSARLKLYTELKARYLLDPNAPLFGAFLEEWRRVDATEEKDLLAFVLLALNDRMVMLVSCQWLYPRLRKADSELRVGDLIAFLQSLGKQQQPEISEWTEATTTRVARHFLASVRDCGLAQGAVRKWAHRPALYPGPIRLLLKALQFARYSQADMIVHESFKIIGVAPHEVVGVLSELKRLGSIEFRQQADVIELTV